MLLSEFENLTDIYPDTELYEEIQREYENGDWDDKQTFCCEYKLNIDGLATRIQHRANERLWKQEDKHRRAMTESSNRIIDLHSHCQALIKQKEELEKRLDMELEWKPAENVGTNLPDGKYYDLLSSSASDVMTEDQVKEYLYRNFGFAKERITLVPEVCTFEVNRHGKLRVKTRDERKPLYCSSDYNYIRFDCAGNQWEVIDGELVPYYD